MFFMINGKFSEILLPEIGDEDNAKNLMLVSRPSKFESKLAFWHSNKELSL